MHDTRCTCTGGRQTREPARQPPARPRGVSGAGLALFGLAALAACARPDASYHVRAEVISVEGEGPELRVVLAHEPIAAFVGRDGRAAVMPAMRMAFGLAPDIDAATLGVGTKWMVSFDVRWGREPTLLITRVRRLPDAIGLELGEHH